MKEIMWPIVLVLGAFIAVIAIFGVFINKSNKQPETDFVFDKGDYRYVKLEEEQFNQLIKALENIASAKESK